MKRRNEQSGTMRQPARRGFTLVELLVTVALVVLMMTMFAEIFSLATEAVSAQKGAAVNDQKVRTFTTLLRTDIESRTFRDVMPFQTVDPSIPEEVTAFTDSFTGLQERRQGYFSISENDPNDPTDDVLAFTVDLDNVNYGYRDGILYGRSSSRDWSGNNDYDPDYDPANYPLDQPEFDDGVPDNGQSASTMAEVVYFLRNGNLYRSVMLIREPYAPDPPNSATFQENQPSNGGVDLFTANEPRFWNFYDFSAFRDPVSGVVKFHTVNSLNNSFESPDLMTMPDGTQVPPSLGIPHLRFGHTIYGFGGTGAPDEYAQVASTPIFIGRPLKQELSAATTAYPYPGESDLDPPPMAAGTFDPATGLVAPYHTAIDRRGTELLVPNVHEFDIQVWDDDPRLPNGSTWADVGHNMRDGSDQPVGYYNREKNRNWVYCPPNRYRFDTWHPRWGSHAPFRAIHHDPVDVGNGILPSTSPDQRPGVAGEDNDGDGMPDSVREGGWIGSDDEMPLRKIRVRVRFYDVQSGQSRQLTLTLPLTDNGG